jgi:hypothetical protein
MSRGGAAPDGTLAAVVFSPGTSVGKTGPESLRPELRATAIMLVVEHGRAVSKADTWQVAVMVLRYFVAVPLLRPPRGYFRGAVG